MDCVEKVQHLQRCSPRYIHYPRVACTIVWQPWAIKSTTLTALKHSIHIMIHIFSRLNIWRIAPKKRNTYSVEKCVLIYYLQHNSLKYH